MSGITNNPFPIDLGRYNRIKIDPWTQERLYPSQKKALLENIELCRAAIVFFTACGSASGYGGHTGGAYDTVPEVMLMDSFFRAKPDEFVPIYFDEAGHRVATQYVMSVLEGHLEASHLSNYRRGHANLPGHPELGATPGVKFSSGRLGHMWAYVNGVAMANPGKVVFMLGSDGSQMEGDNAEAARLAVAQNLNVKLVIDDNNVTIAGHPSNYMKGYSVSKTLEGHGLNVTETPGEDIDLLYQKIRSAVINKGPQAVVCKRDMAPGIKGIEGETHGHDAIPVKFAIPYLESRGYYDAVNQIKAMKKSKDPQSSYLGSGKKAANRKEFGVVVSDILDRMPLHERLDKVRVIDSDLEGSTGLKTIRQRHPECYVRGGIMERGNISAAAGFGMEKGRQGIFSTFAAFLEMCISELTMSRLNNSNLLCHFSHSGVDDMADNSCHFGLNNFFADNGLSDQYPTKLYFPADAGQLRSMVESIFFEKGMRFVFTTRSSLPQVLNSKGDLMYGKSYKFVPGKDEVIIRGSAGYIVSFGDALYRSIDAAHKLRKQGIDIGVINKPTLNVVDEDMMRVVGSSKLCLVVESLNVTTGLGVRYGTWLLERGFSPKYAHIGTHREGSGGTWEQVYHQGFDSKSIIKKVISMVQHNSKL